MAAPVNPLRSIVAVLGGILLLSVLDQVLEATLVNAVADAPVTDMAAYLAVRNRPPLLLAKVGFDAVAAVLAGYLTAKVAGVYEIHHAAAAAALQTLALALAFTVGQDAAATPAWTRIALVVLVAPAMLLGATIRARAARPE